MSILGMQGAGIVVGGGDCPLGPQRRRLGDPRPLFELVVPPRAAKAAFPVLLSVTLGGLALPALRQPRANKLSITA